MTILVNMYGGPGTGKSTSAAGVYSLLKTHGVNAELVTEFAKDLTWEERHDTLGNQPYIFGKQYHRLMRLNTKVDVIVTDGPLLNSILYNDGMIEELDPLVLRCYEEFTNRNYFLVRSKPYQQAGRTQCEAAAKALDNRIRAVLDQLNKPYSRLWTDDAIAVITAQTEMELNAQL